MENWWSCRWRKGRAGSVQTQTALSSAEKPPRRAITFSSLAQVNQYGCDLFRVAHGFVYLNEDVDENERESLVSMYGWDEDDLYSDEFNGILAEAVFETSAAEYDTSAEYSSFEAAARALGHLIDVDIGKYLQI